VRRSNQILAMRNSYHGRSFAAMGITGNRGWSASSLSPVTVHYVHGGDPYRTPLGHLSPADYVEASVADLRHVLATATSGDVACLIAEPIQGVGGFTVPPDGLLGRFKEVLDEHGILLVSDEVQTGWGRTGEHFWGIEAHGAVPDMLTFAKGLGNGAAIGGVVARGELMDALTANSIATFGGNHLSTTAALATLNYLLDHDLQGNALKVGARLAEGLRGIAARHAVVGDVRGKGLMLGVELVVPGSGDPDPGVATRVLEEAKQRGLLVGKGGLYGNTLRIAPPLSVTEAEADEALGILGASVAAAEG
jgi:4-aminobutyrate aminotransferase